MTGQQLKNSILQEAIEGRLVPQDPNDEPASVLLERIRAEKARLVKEKKIKKDKNESRIYRTEDGHWMEHFEDKSREDICIDEEIPFELPGGWEWCRMQKIIDFINGRAYKKEELLLSGKYKVLRVGNFFTNNSWYYSDLELPEEKYCNKGDLLYAWSASFGPKIWDGDKTIFHYHIWNVKYNQAAIKRDYLFYFLLYDKTQISKSTTGSTMIHVSMENMKPRIIPLPPLAEQHRIVEKIESLLPKVEAYGKAQEELVKLTEALPEQLKKSILQEAIEGRLVPQEPNDEPASVLLECIRAEKARLVKEKKIKKDKNESRIYRTDDGHWMEHFEDKNREDICIDEEIPFDVPSGWEWERLGNISQSIQYGYNAPAEVSGIIRMVRISDIQENKVIWDSIPYCNIKESDIDNYLLCPNDILFARTGGTVGKSFLVKDTPYKAIYAGYLIRTRYSNMLRPEYLKYYMESRLYWEQLRNGTIATAQPNCNGQTLSKMFVPIPPLAEQHRIVEKIESLLPKIEKLKVNK